MNPARQIQKTLNAEVRTLLRENSIVVREKIPSTTAVYVGNFLVCKSVLSKFLLRLGFSRGKHVTWIGRLYFKVNNFAEIILALYYLFLLDRKTFKEIASTPELAIKGIVKNKISISAPMTYYLEFRNRLFIKRCISMGISKYDALEERRDTLWISKVASDKSITSEQLIIDGEAAGVSPSIICIALIEHNKEREVDFKLYKEKNLAVIQKLFITHHYIRAMLSRVIKKFSNNYTELSALLGFTHADINAMATEYQDTITNTLEAMHDGKFIDI